MDEPWRPGERRVLDRLDREERIQAFLDRLEYSADLCYRSPREVLRDRKAHCTDGALFAAACLGRLGHPPLVMELKAVRDDDHLLAPFRRGGRWGAVAKSNFVSLRFREPIHRTLRELALTYFEFYYNLDGEKTLREYSLPLDLRRCDRLGWRTAAAGIDEVIRRLEARPHYGLVTPAQAARLAPVDRRTYDACMQGAVAAGIYRPPRRQAP